MTNQIPSLPALKQVKEICLYCKDLAAAEDFYHTQLRLPVIGKIEGKHIFFRVGHNVLLIFNPDDSSRKVSPPAHFAEGKQHLAFEASREDYSSWKKYIEDLGIPIIDQLTWSSGQESFYFHDPEGNILEIVPEGVWGD